MPKVASTLKVVFSGISYLGAQFGFPYEVNREFVVTETSRDQYKFTGEPDANGIWPVVTIGIYQGNMHVIFQLWKDNSFAPVFDGTGQSPIANTVSASPDPQNPQEYGGTATVT